VLAVLVAMFVHLLVTNGAFEWGFMVDNMFRPPIIRGVKGTILLTICAMVLGVSLGILMAVMRLSSSWVLSSIAFVYTWFFRAVPRLVLCVLFGSLGILWPKIGIGVPFDTYVGALFGVEDLHLRIANLDANQLLSGFVAGLLALGLSEAAYMAEIVRAGVQSIDRGQSEAAEALGMTRRQTMRRIVLPQAMRVIVPPTGNEFINMLKTSSLAYAIQFPELLNSAVKVYSNNLAIVELLFTVSIWYVVLTSVFSVFQYYVEKRFARGSRPTARGGVLGAIGRNLTLRRQR
jgi:polar amino acid transport system permease protein